MRQIVTSNAAEGLFGRLTTWLRKKGVKKVGKNTYGHLLAEFLWAHNTAEQETSTFSLTFYAVFEIGKMRFLTMYLNHNLCDDPYPKNCSQQFQSILRPAEAHDSALPRVVPDLAASPRVVPDVAAPPRVVPDVAAPLSASEDSDVKIVCVWPGKRPRVGEGILNVEPLMKSLLPVGSQVKLERAVKSEPSSESSGHQARKSKFCPQGHAAVFKQQAVSTSTTVVRRRQKHWVHTDTITCDVCKAEVAGGAWRCDRCNWGRLRALHEVIFCVFDSNSFEKSRKLQFMHAWSTCCAWWL